MLIKGLMYHNDSHPRNLQDVWSREDQSVLLCNALRETIHRIQKEADISFLRQI